MSCENKQEPRPEIRPDMTILDIVSRYPAAENIFRKYDNSAGVCLCCQALFDPLNEVALKYGLNLNLLIDDLIAAASEKSHNIE